MNVSKEGSKERGVSGNLLSKKMDVLDAAMVGDLSALKNAIKRGEDVNSVNEVSWFVGM